MVVIVNFEGSDGGYIVPGTSQCLQTRGRRFKKLTFPLAKQA